MVTISPEEATRRVERGMAYMDEAATPVWVVCIDTDVLNVADPCRCIKGQFGWPDALKASQADIVTQGMMLSDNEYDDYDQNYAALTAEWKRQILQARLQRALFSLSAVTDEQLAQVPGFDPQASEQPRCTC